ncbi:uncharacterized protein LOC108703276 [Xenopus laevis]|uniref:Uncharacterized protein LOC108703276 n=2 Tax=Xenopus laevis TaxID=8355 RepID=A0A1L8ERC3_XENLA|nr:uncharacterized protein LOC108703276 [Xenopus laevis]XP_018094881.1 uncharacterized protein LOC108703276 [Xenopus laevis]OCT61906.1 hypothetical protein XELAEV_18047938mg [Xenopus laevis]
MEIRGCQIIFILCLIFRKVFSQVSELNDETLSAHINQQVTLNCSLLTAEDWKQNKVQVIWFKDFTEKLLDCVVDKGNSTNCQYGSRLSRAQLSAKIMDGNAALEFSNVRESDGGTYQCWVIFPQFYNKKYIALQIQGEEKEASAVGESSGMKTMDTLQTNSSWKIMLISGWFIALVLAGVILLQRYCIRNKRLRYNTFIL